MSNINTTISNTGKKITIKGDKNKKYKRTVYRGTKGGLFYKTKGKKHYLTKSQKATFSNEKIKEKVKKIRNIRVPSKSEFEHDIVAKEGCKACVICLDRQPLCVIQPCMHKILCIQCGYKLGKGKERKTVPCPTCRKGIEKISRIYE